jgi:hypothetical protein
MKIMLGRRLHLFGGGTTLGLGQAEVQSGFANPRNKQDNFHLSKTTLLYVVSRTITSPPVINCSSLVPVKPSMSVLLRWTCFDDEVDWPSPHDCHYETTRTQLQGR